jgi:hypothetical protein
MKAALHNDGFLMDEHESITRLKEFIGKRVEIIAFGISYMGILKEVDYDQGTLQLVDGEDFAILELERVESFALTEDRRS